MGLPKKKDRESYLWQHEVLSKPLPEQIRIIREGMPWNTVSVFFDAANISQREASAHLSIPVRTFARRKKEGLFTPEESNKLLRMMRVVSRGLEVFDSVDGVNGWLHRPNRSMGGKPPLSLLDTDLGAELVLDTLGRIEHGVFS